MRRDDSDGPGDQTRGEGRSARAGARSRSAGGGARTEEEKLEPTMVLAALARAQLHAAEPTREIPFWTLLEHLDVRRRSPRARAVRAVLSRFEEAGALERETRHGVPVWRLTGAGRRRLRRAQRAGRVPELPESPQHAAWRRARTTAEQELERMRAELGEALARAQELLEARAQEPLATNRSEEPAAARTTGVAPTCPPGDPATAPLPSDRWFELGRLLRDACRRLGSAEHVLREWSEPDDERADVDTRVEPGEERLDRAVVAQRRALRAGRRNVALWSRE